MNNHSLKLFVGVSPTLPDFVNTDHERINIGTDLSQVQILWIEFELLYTYRFPLAGIYKMIERLKMLTTSMISGRY